MLKQQRIALDVTTKIYFNISVFGSFLRISSCKGEEVRSRNYFLKVKKFDWLINVMFDDQKLQRTFRRESKLGGNIIYKSSIHAETLFDLSYL